jgi:site-specific DNA-methyltransferase (adenine-specific)
MFPEELPKRLIKMFSFIGETVLDPFAGSGTTALAAKNLERNSVGFEINPEFIPFIKTKLEVHQTDLSGTTYEFVTQHQPAIDFEEEINKLPYIFKDPHTLDKKIDVKKLQFGSKIDQDSPSQREQLYTVKEIISPAKIRLSNDLTIKLIGIKEDPFVNGKATAFLIEKTKGKRVFLKYDNIKYDNKNNLLCYLYLENKTFVNAHLIKSGLVQVDNDSDFKYKNKFNSLIQTM